MFLLLLKHCFVSFLVDLFYCHSDNQLERKLSFLSSTFSLTPSICLSQKMIRQTLTRSRINSLCVSIMGCYAALVFYAGFPFHMNNQCSHSEDHSGKITYIVSFPRAEPQTLVFKTRPFITSS